MTSFFLFLSHKPIQLVLLCDNCTYCLIINNNNNNKNYTIKTNQLIDLINQYKKIEKQP